MKRLIILLILIIVFPGCSKNQESNEQSKVKKSPDTSTQAVNTKNSSAGDKNSQNKNFEHFGNYVDAAYKDRASGADWVSVNVSPYSIGRVMVSVRSRADKMKPTCTYYAVASVINENELMSTESLGTIIFKFSGNDLTISAGEGSQEALLTYYCRGGGSLAGTYKKLDEGIDQSQIDKRSYVKSLNLKNSDIEFFIEVTGNVMSITPAGLKGDNKTITHKIDGYVNEAEIADLNSDGSPEIYVYTVSEGTGRFGDVIAYSVNNGKSVSQINFPKIESNKEAYDGYGGKDEFAIVENSLVRRFPIFKEGDANSAPSGGTKQIQYKLTPGEASWQLVVDKIIVY